MMDFRIRALVGAAALLTAAFATPVTAQVPSDFKRLADNLAKAVRQTDDDATLEYAGQLRALGRPLGNEINLIEAEALSRRHNNDAAFGALTRYLSGKMRQPARAKALKKELDARLAAANKTWERKFKETSYGTYAAFEDGTFYRVMTVKDDLAYQNMVVERYDATSGPLWRMVYGGSVRSDYHRQPLLSSAGRIIVPTRYYNQGWKELFTSYYQPSEQQLVGVDPSGRLTLPDGAVKLKSVVWYQGGGIFVSDSEGGFYAFTSKPGHDRGWLVRYDASAREIWSIPIQSSTHPIGTIKSLVKDDAGNVYVWSEIDSINRHLYKIRKQGMYLDVYSPEGKRVRAMPVSGTGILAGSLVQKNFEPDDIAISGDGSTLFTREKKADKFEINAYAFPSMLHLWARPTRTVIKDAKYGDLRPFKDGVLYVSAQQSPSDKKAGKDVDFSIQRLDGASGTIVWERKRAFNSKGAYSLSYVDVRPTGIFVSAQEGNVSSLSFLSNAEIASLEVDPRLEPPVTDIWPFSNEISKAAALEIAAARAAAQKKAAAARALTMQNEAQSELNTAEQAMRQCQLTKAAENGVGVLKTVDTDFGFVVIKMNTDFATNKDLAVVLADGRLAPLTFGKAPNKWEISAMPGDAGQIKAMAPGQVVVSKEGIPESKCPAQKIALDSARSKMAEIKRAVAPDNIPGNTGN